METELYTKYIGSRTKVVKISENVRQLATPATIVLLRVEYHLVKVQIPS